MVHVACKVITNEKYSLFMLAYDIKYIVMYIVDWTKKINAFEMYLAPSGVNSGITAHGCNSLHFSLDASAVTLFAPDRYKNLLFVQPHDLPVRTPYRLLTTPLKDNASSSSWV